MEEEVGIKGEFYNKQPSKEAWKHGVLNIMIRASRCRRNVSVILL